METGRYGGAFAAEAQLAVFHILSEEDDTMDQTIGAHTLSPQTAGIVLAGGRSSRMGRDKRACTFQGQEFLSLAVALTGGLGQRFLSSNDDRFSFPGVTAVPDAKPGLGPVGGLASVLPHVALPWVLLLPCDMPRLNAGMLCQLFDLAGQGWDAVLFRDEQWRYPLPLLCRTRAAWRLVRLSQEREQYSIERLIRTADISCREQAVSEEICRSRGMDNVNTPQDYRALNPESEPG